MPVYVGGSQLSSDCIPCVLRSAPDINIEGMRKFLLEKHVRYFIPDSGGYQIYQAQLYNVKVDQMIHRGEEPGGIKKIVTFDRRRPIENSKYRLNICPEHIVHIARELNAYMMIGLDYPIEKLSDQYEQDNEFMSKLGYNITWARQMSALRSRMCPDIKMLLPVQCYNLEQFQSFYDSLHGVAYDGFSMPVRNLATDHILLFFLRFYRLGIRYVHLLGTASFPNLALMAYAARHLFEWMSFDAASAAKSAMGQQYMDPDNLRGLYLGDRSRLPAEPIRCPCPYCHLETFESLHHDYADTDRGYLLENHNWWVVEHVAQDLYEKAVDSYMLLRHVEKVASKHQRIRALLELLPIAETYIRSRDILQLEELLPTLVSHR